MSEPTFICTRCHGEAPMSERREFDGRDYCPRCLDAITAICHICGTRIPLTHNHGTEDVPRKARELDYLSHKAGICGLHVHVSRAAFGETEQHQDAAIARVLYFFEKHWEELLKFSRRTQKQLNDWASRYGYKTEPKDILDHAKSGGGRGRYTAVNLTNTDTVEFRLFRGTLKLNTILATLQLLDRICDVALHLSDDGRRAAQPQQPSVSRQHWQRALRLRAQRHDLQRP